MGFYRTPSGHHLPVTTPGAAQLSLPTGLPCNGPFLQQPLTPNDTALRRQRIINLTYRDSSQRLTANPAFIFNKMSDAAFKTCYHLRHMFLVLNSACVAPRLIASGIMPWCVS